MLLSDPFRDLDAQALHGFVALRDFRAETELRRLRALGEPGPYVVAALAILAVAVLRRERRLAVVLAAALAGSAVTTQAIKVLWGVPRVDPWLAERSIATGTSSWPSGHATGTMTLALCAMLAVPAAWRAVVAALGVLFSLAVSFSMLALGAHYPSDILGGYLVAEVWVLLALAALATTERRRDRVDAREADLRPALWAAVPVAAVAVLAAVLRTHALLAHPAAIALAAAIVALALAVVTLPGVALPRTAPGRLTAAQLSQPSRSQQ